MGFLEVVPFGTTGRCTVFLFETRAAIIQYFLNQWTNFVVTGLIRKNLISFNIWSDINVFKSAEPSPRLVLKRAKGKKIFRKRWCIMVWTGRRFYYYKMFTSYRFSSFKMPNSPMDRRWDQETAFYCYFYLGFDLLPGRVGMTFAYKQQQQW